MPKKQKRVKIDNPDSELVESLHNLLDSIQIGDGFGILKDTVRMYGKLTKNVKAGIKKKEPVIEVVTDEIDFDKSNKAKRIN